MSKQAHHRYIRNLPHINFFHGDYARETSLHNHDSSILSSCISTEIPMSIECGASDSSSPLHPKSSTHKLFSSNFSSSTLTFSSECSCFNYVSYHIIYLPMYRPSSFLIATRLVLRNYYLSLSAYVMKFWSQYLLLIIRLCRRSLWCK